ncbi:MAG: methionine--tRNA ligase [Alphaproteobacteria bacterium]|nr:methionine--tRNA ligase [Alphaproteobacteria bacterium]
MTKKYLITSALPYVNNNLHIGHLIGCWLPSDVYARFCRAMGRDVLYVCGADEHGTTSEVGARKENMPIEQYVDKYRTAHEQSVRDFNLSFDIYGRTHTQKHADLIQSLFKRLDEQGMLVEKTSMQPYSVNEQMFLADRFVIGTCPKCGFDGAYGNECGKCSATLEPEQLINPHSAITPDSPVEMRETKHLYFRTSAMQDKLREWINSRVGWSRTAMAIANKWLDEGLHDSPITRDLKWGIPVNKPGYENKVFYVWFDAPWGYISISQAANDKWAEWWHGGDDVKYAQFMAKDNVSFHSIFFPAQELAMNDNWKTVDILKGFNFLNFNGAKISKSTGNGIFLNEAINDAPADAWRYALLASAPETDDTDFTIARFADIVNKDLNGMLGNFVSRVCKLTAKNFGTNVPAAGEWDTELESQINEKISELTSALDACEFRNAIAALRGLYAIGNEYMTKMEPWALVKNGDMAGAGDALNKCFQLIDLYARVSAPFIPGTAEKMQNVFVTQNDLSWPEKFVARIADGAEFVVPENLFNRIDDETVAKLTEKYTPKVEDNSPKLVVAEIVAVKDHPSRDDLHILSVNAGGAPVQVVCGAPNVRVGLRGVLAPVGCKLPGAKKPMAQRTVAGVESFGMMCSAAEVGQGDNGNVIIELGADATIGAEYKLN